MDGVKLILQTIDERKDMFVELSDRIWDFAETKFQEFQSADLYCKLLEQEGFRVERGIGGLETAFKGTYGSGGPSIGLLGEFDALPDLSQEAGIWERRPIVPGGNGHGCGHNIFGAAVFAAAVALKKYLDESGKEGTIVFYGCPAEEGGSGKTWMVKAGCFQDIDVALTWHPGNVNCVQQPCYLASIQATFQFKGLSSHAGAAPHLGRSALDAAELMNVGVQFLREHVIQEARMHGAFLNAGGRSANIIPSDAALLYQFRAPHMSDVQDIYQRVIRIAKGAAMMTDTEVEVQFDRACSEIRPNDVLNEVMYRAFQTAGPVPVDDNDRAYAAKIYETLSPSAKVSDEIKIRDEYKRADLAQQLHGKEIMDFILPLECPAAKFTASTDVGDVSQIVPLAQIMTADYANGTPAHSWQLVAQGKSPLAHKGMLQSGKVIALSALDLFENPELVEKAKQEFAVRFEADPYVSPIPDGAAPRMTK